MTVSVVIPAFNAAEFLPDALRSVLQQTHPRASLEVIVVDDGSTDETAQVVTRTLAAGGIRNRVIRHETPRGPSCARNAGWRASDGHWIQFLDADDVLDVAKIAHQAGAAAAAEAQTAAVYSRWGRLDLRNGEWTADEASHEPALRPDPILAVMSPAGFIHIGSILIRREWLEAVGGFDERFRLIEDVDLELRLLMHGAQLECAPSARPLYWYRNRPGSLSRSSVAGFFEGSARNARLAEEYWRSRGELTPERRQWLASHYFSCARNLAEHNPSQLETLAERIYALSPTFQPPHGVLRALTRVVGYTRAERVFVGYRRFKRMLARNAVGSAGPRVSSSAT